MNQARDIAFVAARLRSELGSEAATIIARRAEAISEAGDKEAAEYWRRVAAAMTQLEDLSHKGGPDIGEDEASG